MPGRMELLVEKKRFQVTVGIVVFILLLGVIAPFFTMDPKEYTGEMYEPPSWNHKLGTDSFGRDVWARLMCGIRHSLMIGLAAGLISLAIAFVVGGIGAYKGGLTDEGLNLASNVFLTLPVIPILIVLAVLFEQRSLLLLAFIMGILGWPAGARAIRSQVLSLKEREFVDLARVTGKGGSRILLMEIFPNMLAFVFISFFGIVGGAIIAEAGISLIGLGPTAIPTLGNMLHWAIMTNAVTMGIWWWFVPPGLIIISITGSLIMIGSVMDDVLNPKLRGVLG